MNNRRNFYRILHVQPEAPLDVIKASYRSMMTKLKAHPDLGGDHAQAVLINQAYNILSDPQKRRQYDEMLHSRRNHGRAGGQPDTATNRHRCIFCKTGVTTNKYCSGCNSPTTPAQAITKERFGELFGRRAVPRTIKTETLAIYPSWPHAGYAARLRDLSPAGLSLVTAYGARSGQILKFESSTLNGLAHIVSVRANGANFCIHAAFLTAEFRTKSGVFVAEKA